MNKLTFLCTFFALPLAAGEWDRPFWQQAAAMLLLLLLLGISVVKGLKNAPTYEEWEEMNRGR